MLQQQQQQPVYNPQPSPGGLYPQSQQAALMAPQVPKPPVASGMSYAQRSQQATVQHRIVWQVPLGTEPTLLVGRPRFRLQWIDRVYGTDFDGTIPGQGVAEMFGNMGSQQFAVLLLGFKAFRIRCRGHVELMFETFFGHLE